MVDSNLKPVGLYVEQGRELVHANTKSGWGNFHIKPSPNALFLDGGSASNLYAPAGIHPSNLVPLGPMLAVFENDRGTSYQQ
jgi:uncharacterized protein YigE (DUF2233 family)